jgi:hypothetical protein
VSEGLTAVEFESIAALPEGAETMLHAYVSGNPAGSELPLPSRVMTLGGCAVWLVPAFAVGPFGLGTAPHGEGVHETTVPEITLRNNWGEVKGSDSVLLLESN